MTDQRIAFLVLLGSALAVTSCAALVERQPRTERVVQAVPIPSLDPLAGRELLVPVHGMARERLRDNFHERRGKRVHLALDIMAKRGTPVLAADDGRVAKMYRHPLGGLCVYQYDTLQEHAYYYAHLDAFAPGLKEGVAVKRGDLIGYVGTTGNASPTAPHLHFALIRLGPERKWYRGTPLNPYPYLASGR